MRGNWKHGGRSFETVILRAAIDTIGADGSCHNRKISPTWILLYFDGCFYFVTLRWTVGKGILLLIDNPGLVFPKTWIFYNISFKTAFCLHPCEYNDFWTRSRLFVISLKTTLRQNVCLEGFLIRHSPVATAGTLRSRAGAGSSSSSISLLGRACFLRDMSAKGRAMTVAQPCAGAYRVCPLMYRITHCSHTRASAHQILWKQTGPQKRFSVRMDGVGYNHLEALARVDWPCGSADGRSFSFEGKFGQ